MNFHQPNRSVYDWNAGTQYTAEELAEEVAWVLIETEGWIPTPMLLMWLTRYVNETVDCKAYLDACKVEE